MSLQALEADLLWLMSDGNAGWITAFYGVMILLGLTEGIWPAFQQSARRKERWPANYSLALTNAALATVLPISSVLSAQWAQRHGVGILNQAPDWVWTAALATLLARSLLGYGIHVLMHKVPVLWRLHRVHHLDTHVDISTTLRSHPIEFLLTTFLVVSASIAVGMTPWMLILYEMIEALVVLVSHANIRIHEPLDRALRWLLVTPNMHCLHHSSYQPETDSNYGGVFSVWDRLFGTYSGQPVAGYENMEIGLD